MGIIILTVFCGCAGSSDTPKRFATGRRHVSKKACDGFWRCSRHSKINSQPRCLSDRTCLSYRRQKVRSGTKISANLYLPSRSTGRSTQYFLTFFADDELLQTSQAQYLISAVRRRWLKWPATRAPEQNTTRPRSASWMSLRPIRDRSDRGLNERQTRPMESIWETRLERESSLK